MTSIDVAGAASTKRLHESERARQLFRYRSSLPATRGDSLLFPQI